MLLIKLYNFVFKDQMAVVVMEILEWVEVMDLVEEGMVATQVDTILTLVEHGKEVVLLKVGATIIQPGAIKEVAVEMVGEIHNNQVRV
jgi:hypothetical protein